MVFNSFFNMESFLSSINSFLKLMPDHHPEGLDQLIETKCRVVYFPLIDGDLSKLSGYKQGSTLHSNEADKNKYGESEVLIGTLS